MERLFTAIIFSCVLLIAHDAAAATRGAANFRCGLQIGDAGMDYQPSQGWKKQPERIALRYSETHFRRSHSAVFLEPESSKLTLAMAQPRFEVERNIAPPLSLAKAGCTWR